MLAQALNLRPIAFHMLCEDQWSTLPDRTLLAIHWHWDEIFFQDLKQNGFQVFTLLRHPLDVLISILHFCIYEPQTENWLLGRGGNERPIWGALPTSHAFKEYCQSTRAFELLSVSAAWANIPGTRFCRYEDLVRDPAETLKTVCQNFAPAETPWETIARNHSLANMRKARPEGVDNRHFWKGKPDSWKAFLTTEIAEQVAPNLKPFMELFGYSIENQNTLTTEQAERNWLDAIGPELRESLSNKSSFHQQQRNELLEKIESLKLLIAKNGPDNLEQFSGYNLMKLAFLKAFKKIGIK